MLNPPLSAHDHIQGSPDADIVLVEYGDYECPYCGAAYPVVKELQKRLKVTSCPSCFATSPWPMRIRMPNLPRKLPRLPPRKESFGRCTTCCMSISTRLEPENLIEYATTLGLDLHRFTKEINEHVYATRVREDFRSGVRERREWHADLLHQRRALQWLVRCALDAGGAERGRGLEGFDRCGEQLKMSAP